MNDLTPTGSLAPGSSLDNHAVAKLLALWLSSKDSPHTHRSYRRAVQDYAHFQRLHVEEALLDLLANGHGHAAKCVLSWRADLMLRVSPSTVNQRLSALQSFVACARMIGAIMWDVSVPQVRSRGPYCDTRGLGRARVQKILAHLVQFPDDPTRARDYAIIRLMYDMAFRADTVRSLDLSDFDPDTRILRIREKGTRGEQRPVKLPPPTTRAIQNWVRHRGDWGDSLFVRTDPRAPDGDRGRLSHSAIVSAAQKHAKAAGVRGHVTPHKFRHTSITDALDATNGDVRAVREFSGHKCIETLLKYDDNRRDLAGMVANLVAGD